MSTQRGSCYESESSCANASGSRSADTASSKPTPCFSRFEDAFFESHSTTIFVSSKYIRMAQSAAAGPARAHEQFSPTEIRQQ